MFVFYNFKDTLLILFVAFFVIAVIAEAFLIIRSRQQSLRFFVKTPPEEICGETITLKLLKREFFEDLHKVFVDEEVVGNFENWTLSKTVAHFSLELKKVAEGKVLHYCIFDNKDKKFIGAIDIRIEKATCLEQFGIWVDKNYLNGNRIPETMDLIAKIYFALKVKIDTRERKYIERAN
jgi:hypothetical protein